MAKEILLYTGIYSYSAAAFINELEANKGTDIRVRGNCPGGDMFSTYGMIAKFKEHPQKKEIQVDGIAASAFAYMLCFADNVECLDVSAFLYHRAAYGNQDDEKSMTPNERQILDNVNASIRSGLEAKVSNDKFKQVSGYSYDQLFSMDGRLDVILNADQMKQLGLVTKINKLTEDKKAEILGLSNSYSIAAFAGEPIIQATDNIINMAIMTAAEFKAANPSAYAEIEAAAAKAAVENEKDRTGSWMAFAEVDPVAVKAGIASGERISQTQLSEFSIKAFSKTSLGEIQTATAPNAEVATTETKPAELQAKAELDAFNAEVKANLKKMNN